MDVVLILNTMQIQPTVFNVIKQKLIKDGLSWSDRDGRGS